MRSVKILTRNRPNSETNKQPIRTRYIDHVTGHQPVRDQYFLIRSVPSLDLHGDEYALKIINLLNPADVDLYDAIFNEVTVLTDLTPHPNIITMNKAFHKETTVYVLLELAKEGVLFDFVSKSACLMEKTAAGLFRQLLLGLKHLHDNGIVHRDIKMENLLISDNRTLKLTDFGFAKKLQNGEKLKDLCGTLSYLSPEMIRAEYGSNKHGYGKEVDMWACGVLLYILLMGQPPFSNYRKVTVYDLGIKQTNKRSGKKILFAVFFQNSLVVLLRFFWFVEICCFVEICRFDVNLQVTCFDVSSRQNHLDINILCSLTPSIIFRYPAIMEPSDTSKQPIRTRYLGHVTGYQPTRDQYFLIRSVPAEFLQSSSSSSFRRFLLTTFPETMLVTADTDRTRSGRLMPLRKPILLFCFGVLHLGFNEDLPHSGMEGRVCSVNRRSGKSGSDCIRKQRLDTYTQLSRTRSRVRSWSSACRLVHQAMIGRGSLDGVAPGYAAEKSVPKGPWLKRHRKGYQHPDNWIYPGRLLCFALLYGWWEGEVVSGCVFGRECRRDVPVGGLSGGWPPGATYLGRKARVKEKGRVLSANQGPVFHDSVGSWRVPSIIFLVIFPPFFAHNITGHHVTDSRHRSYQIGQIEQPNRMPLRKPILFCFGVLHLGFNEDLSHSEREGRDRLITSVSAII
eukprot:sb/3462707/